MPEAPARGYGYRTRDDSRARLGVPAQALTDADLNNIGERTAAADTSPGSVVSTATLALTSTGLLFYDRFNRADAGTWGADWTLTDAGTFSIVSNAGRVVPAIGNGQRSSIASILAVASEHVVQAYFRAHATEIHPGIRSRWDGGNDTNGYALVFDPGIGFSLYRTSGGALTLLGSAALATTAINSLYGGKLHTKNSYQRAYADGRLLVSAADATHDATTGKAGVRTRSDASLVEWAEYEDFAVYSSNTVTVTALPAGYQVRVNGVLFPSVAGTATCDLAAAMCPLQSIEVLDGSNSVVCTLTPSAGVWGGDVYSFNPVGTLNGLTATPLSPTSIRLEWPEIADATGYKIERHNGDAVWSTVATNAAGVLTYLQTGLTEGATRFFRVTAIKDAAEGQPSGAVSATTLPTPPTDLHATSIASGAVVLVWTDLSSKEVNYQLQRAPGVNGTVFADIGTIIAANGTTKTDTTATAGNGYRYRVATIDAAGQRSFSNELGVTIDDIGVNITLSATGLLFRDLFNRADGAPGADWTVVSGTWTINSNKLRGVADNNQTRELQLVAGALAARKEFHCQYYVTRANNKAWCQFSARMNAGRTIKYVQTIAADDAGGGQANESHIYQYNAGFNLISRVAGGAAGAGVQQRCTFSILGTGAPVVLRSWIDGTRDSGNVNDSTAANNITGSIGFGTFGQPAGPASSNVDIDDMIVCSSRTVTLAGLPAGFKLRLAGITSAASDGVNPVTADILAAQMPIASLEVIDGAANTIRTLNPGAGIFGGDIYAIDGAAIPPAPPPTPPTTVDIGIGPPGVFDGVTVGITNYNTGVLGESGTTVIVSHPATGAWRGTPFSVAQDITFSSAVVEVRVTIASAGGDLGAGAVLTAYDNVGAQIGTITTSNLLASSTGFRVGILAVAGIRTLRVTPPANCVVVISDILFKH